MCAVWSIGHHWSNIITARKRHGSIAPPSVTQKRPKIDPNCGNKENSKVKKVSKNSIKKDVIDLLCPICLQQVKSNILGSHFDKCASNIPFP